MFEFFLFLEKGKCSPSYSDIKKKKDQIYLFYFEIGSHCAALDGLELKNLPASASLVGGLEGAGHQALRPECNP